MKAQFKRLKEKVPGRYDINILKERFFHGMHQHLKDSIRICYKQEETMYEELFCETVKAEKEKVPEIRITSLKAKSAITEPAVTRKDGEGIQDLRQKINALITAVKSSTFGEPGRNILEAVGLPRKGRIIAEQMEVPTRDGVQQPPQWDHLNLDRSTFSVIIVGGGGIVISNVLARGASIGGP